MSHVTCLPRSNSGSQHFAGFCDEGVFLAESHEDGSLAALSPRPKAPEAPTQTSRGDQLSESSDE